MLILVCDEPLPSTHVAPNPLTPYVGEASTRHQPHVLASVPLNFVLADASVLHWLATEAHLPPLWTELTAAPVGRVGACATHRALNLHVLKEARPLVRGLCRVMCELALSLCVGPSLIKSLRSLHLQGQRCGGLAPMTLHV